MYIFNDGDSLQNSTSGIPTALKISQQQFRLSSRWKEAYRLSIQSIASKNKIVVSLKHVRPVTLGRHV